MGIRAFALLNILDTLTTWLGGLQNEVNPVTVAVLSRWGLAGFVAAKVLLVLYFWASVVLMKRMRFPLEKPYKALMVGIYVIVLAWNVGYLWRYG